MRVAIIGQGYVGLTATAGCIKAGHTVVGIDKDELVVKNLNLGISHIEGISSDDLSEAVITKLYYAISDFSHVSNAEIVIIAVPTPLDSTGHPDLSLLESALNSIAPFIGEETLVINESTSYIGTLRNVVAAKIRLANSKVQHFAVSPERVDPGNANFGIRNTPRLVGGISEEATRLAIEFYTTFCEKVIKVSSPEVAEAAKLLENSFRFINIGFVNEFTKILTEMGVSAHEVIEGASTKPYGFMPFFPNAGIGGHCIPVDPLYLQKNAKDIGVASKYIELSEGTNLDMPRYFVNRLEKLYGELAGKKVLVVGVSYKPNISDTRESPAEHVIREIHQMGAFVKWHDPLVSTYLGETSSSVLDDYDLAVVLTRHDSLDMSQWHKGPIFCVRPIRSEPNWIPVLDSGFNPKSK